MLKSKKRTFICALAVCVLISATGITFSGQHDICKKVLISVNNMLAQEIKVTKLQYYDYDVGKWRKETTWATMRVAPKTQRSRHRDLEHVKDDKTKVKIYVKKHKGGSKWKTLGWIKSEPFKCKLRKQVRIHVK